MQLEEDARPVFWLGLAGFAAADREAVAASLGNSPGRVRWELCAFPDADAWCVHGSRVRVAGEGTIHVAPGLPAESRLTLDLTQVNRPIAFARPLPPTVEPLCSFETGDPRSVHGVLARFEQWLAPRQVQIALGREVVRRGATLRHQVIHVLLKGRLLAVLNFRTGRAAIAHEVDPAAVAAAEWRVRPPFAGDLPPQFAQATTAQLCWAFVRHSRQTLLPARYQVGRIHFRGAPKVPMHWLSDPQLLLLRELHAQPGSIEELRQRTGLSRAQVERDLGCLFFSSAITTTPAKALRPPRRPDAPASSPPSVLDLMRATESPEAPVDPSVPMGLRRQYATVPAPLLAERR